MCADVADVGGDKFKVKVIAAAGKLAVGVARLAGAAEQTFLGYDETPTLSSLRCTFVHVPTRLWTNNKPILLAACPIPLGPKTSEF